MFLLVLSVIACQKQCHTGPPSSSSLLCLTTSTGPRPLFCSVPCVALCDRFDNLFDWDLEPQQRSKRNHHAASRSQAQPPPRAQATTQADLQGIPHPKQKRNSMKNINDDNQGKHVDLPIFLDDRLLLHTHTHAHALCTVVQLMHISSFSSA